MVVDCIMSQRVNQNEKKLEKKIEIFEIRSVVSCIYNAIKGKICEPQKHKSYLN